MLYSAKPYSTVKFLWATSIFVILLFVFVTLVLVYSQAKIGTMVSKTNQETISPLAPTTANPEETTTSKTYHSQYDWLITYPSVAAVTTDKGTSLEKLTITQNDSVQGGKGNGVYGYLVTLRVENKTGSLSTFADRDSLKTGNGQREFFAVANLAGKSGYKTLIKGSNQDYISYYLSLKDTSKVLVITTTTNGPGKEALDKTVSTILASLELLD